MDKLIDSFNIQAQKKGIAIKTSFSKAFPDFVHGDEYRLRQVLVNLMNNAIKFTDRGHVLVMCNQERSHDEQVDISFVVSDTGIGIPEEKMEKIYESFVQADNTTTRKYGGTGLGITISKQLIELMGGTLQTKSTVGVGTQFIFTITFELCKNSIEVMDSRPNEVQLISGTKILVVEDSLPNQEITMIHLTAGGCQVHIAENGQAAIESVQQEKYDLIFMDVQMPILDGVNATKAIRSLDNYHARIPIVGMTANAFADDWEKYKHAGMNDILVKPAAKADMYKMINKWLGAPSPTSTPLAEVVPTPTADTVPEETPENIKVHATFHEIGNNLFPLIGVADLMKEKYKDTPTLVEYARWIKEASVKIKNLVSELQDHVYRQ